MKNKKIENKEKIKIKLKRYEDIKERKMALKEKKI